MLKYGKFAIRMVLILGVCLVFCTLNVFADTNVDTGGGSTGGNTDSTTNVFSSGDFGVRFTIIGASTETRIEGTRTVDYYKKNNKSGKTVYHFGATNKFEYLNGGVLGLRDSNYYAGKGLYAYYSAELWNVIESSAFGKKATLQEITAWLQIDSNLKKITTDTHFSYDKLVNGNYKLIAEPIFYVTYGGKYYAMTAHEVAKYDEAVGGDLRRKFGTYSHKNIPLSLFLKKKTLGIKPWLGSKTSITTNKNIKEYLGIAIMSWKEPEPDVDLDSPGDYVYRTNTEVISSIDITAQTEATPDNPITVTFQIPNVGTKTVTNILIPAGYTQKVWCKWTTPDIPQTVIIDVSANGGISKGQIICKVKNLGYREPLNPIADDIKPHTFQPNANPTAASPSAITPLTKAVWTKWERCVWESEIVGYRQVQNGIDDKGNPIYGSEPIYDYYWHFGTGKGRQPGEPTYYSAEIQNAELKIKVDDTVKESNTDPNTMKSGYGLQAALNTKVSTTNSIAVTPLQTSVFYFPESNYQRYWRLGEVTQNRMMETLMELPHNVYSLSENRVHFTPLWFPDKEYKVYTKYYDAWTPVGMLQGYSTAEINIKGTVYDDYHIGIVPFYN